MINCVKASGPWRRLPICQEGGERGSLLYNMAPVIQANKYFQRIQFCATKLIVFSKQKTKKIKQADLLCIYKQADPGVGHQSAKWGQGGLYYLSQLGQAA